MSSIGNELSNLNFESMIGGPLMSVVRAQTQSAIASVDFIKAVGFTRSEEAGKTIERPTMVEFLYTKPVEVDDGRGGKKIEPVEYSLKVPILTMLPIPFIRIEETTIDFNAKITSVERRDVSSSHDLGLELSAGYQGYGATANLKVNYAYKRTSSSGSSVERTYSMAVHVRAVQDEMPAGTERLLSILENNIEEAPKKTT